MGNNDISKFNGQYLKCIVTKHKGTMNALSDKGAMIIYQNNNRNYAYLGNEFIASGYGFKSLDTVNEVESLLNSYDNDLNSIYNKIEQLNKQLLEDLNNINNTFISFSPKYTVKDPLTEHIYELKDIIFTGKNAEYKDFEILSLEKYIIINDEINVRKIEDDLIELPIGTKIKKIIYELSFNINDTSGIKEVVISYFKSYEDYEEYINGNLEKLSLYTVKYSQFNDLLINNKKLKIEINFTKYEDKLSGFYVLNSNKFSIIDSIEINIKGTSEEQYKYYPELKNINLYSIENKINDKIITFNNKLFIKPVTFMYYRINSFRCNDNGEYLDENMENPIVLKLSNIFKDILFDPKTTNNLSYYFTKGDHVKDLKGNINISKTKINDIFFINIPITNEYTNSNVFTFFIPKSFRIHKLLYVTEYSEYNLTGALGYIDIISTDRYYNIYIKSYMNNNLKYYLQSRIYQITIGQKKKLYKEGFFKIELLCVNENFENDLVEDSENNDDIMLNPSYTAFNDNIHECRKWQLLNDEEFNKMHWIFSNELTNDLKINDLTNKLKLINGFIY